MSKNTFSAWTFRAKTFRSGLWTGTNTLAVSSNDFLHSPERILQEVLIGLGLGSDPDDVDVWPISAPTEPDSPDECITVQEYTGIETGSNALSGQMYVHYGLQVRIRARDDGTGPVKAHAIFKALNQSINAYAVSIEDSLYCVDSVTTSGTVNRLGYLRPENRLLLYTVNCTADIKRLI